LCAEEEREINTSSFKRGIFVCRFSSVLCIREYLYEFFERLQNLVSSRILTRYRNTILLKNSSSQGKMFMIKSRIKANTFTTTLQRIRKIIVESIISIPLLSNRICLAHFLKMAFTLANISKVGSKESVARGTGLIVAVARLLR